MLSSRKSSYSLICLSPDIGAAVGEREAQIEDLEDRIARTEAALNTATAQLEEEGDSRSAGSPYAAPRGPNDAVLEPQLPDIVDKGPAKGSQMADDQADRLDHLEDLVSQLQAELRRLQEAHADGQAQLEISQVFDKFSYRS